MHEHVEAHLGVAALACHLRLLGDLAGEPAAGVEALLESLHLFEVCAQPRAILRTEPRAQRAVLLLGGQAEGDVAISFEVAPTQARSDHHAFSPGATFRWQEGAPIALDAWQAASSLDTSSPACVPEYFAAGDFHLADDDACAGDLAVPVAGIEFDIDGDPRESKSWDAGANERP